MKARITGMSTLQGTPLSGTLTVWPDDRFEDGNGNATVGRLDYVLDVPTLTWRNAINPAADAYIVVSAPGEPYPITAMFDESFVFAGQSPVIQHYRRYLQASDLYATEFSYTERQNVRLYNTNEPITMQAARQTVAMKPVLDQALINIAQSRDEALGAAGIDSAYISETTANPSLAAAAGTFGAKRDVSGNLIRLTKTGAPNTGSWVAGGPPLLSAGGAQPIITDRLRAVSLNALKLNRGAAQGDMKNFDGAWFRWDEASEEPDNGRTVLIAAGGGVGRWVFEFHKRLIDIRMFKELVPAGGWMAAINAALLLDSIKIPLGVFNCVPVGNTAYIKVPGGVPRLVLGEGPGSILRVADGTGDYQRLIGQASTAAELTYVTLQAFQIDQNPQGNVGTVMVGDALKGQSAVAFYTFDTVQLLDMFIKGTGVNSATLNGASSRNATVRNFDMQWSKRIGTPELPQPDYDNSALYLNTENHQVQGARFFAESAAAGAWGMIESHGFDSQLSDITGVNFRDGINVVTPSGGGNPYTASQVVTNLNVRGGAYGLRFWLGTGQTMKNVAVRGVIAAHKQLSWPDLKASQGIGINYSAGGALDGHIENLSISDVDITFEPETRNDLAYDSCGGLFLAGTGDINYASIHDMKVTNAPVTAFRIGRAGKTVRHLRMHDIQSINTGTAPSQIGALKSLHVPISVQGTFVDAQIDGFSVIENTATAQASALSHLGALVVVGSDIEVRRLRIHAPNNAPLKSLTVLATNAAIRYYPDYRTRVVEVNVTVPALAPGEIKDVDTRIVVRRDDGVMHVEGGPRGAPPATYQASPPWYAGYDSGTKEMIVRTRFSNPTAVAVTSAAQLWRFTVSD